MAGSGANSGVTGKRQAAIEALMSSKTQAEAAQAAGIGLRTLSRWLRDPDFVAELRAYERSAFDTAGRRLATLASDALDVVQVILDDETVSAPVRLRAAESVLDRLLKWRDAGLEERLDRLERRLGSGEL